MANTVYANKVLEAKAKDLLTTSVNTRNLMTVDNSLAQNVGMTKTINVYTYTGEAEELAAGVGNTASKRGSIAYKGTDYTVKMVQQAFDYLDEDFMKDNTIVDNMLKGANQVMVNKMTSDFITEAKKATLGVTFATAIGYDVIVDAISALNVENESGIFIVIPNAWKAALRKDADYKSARMGEVIYNGQVGTICGIPVIATKALTTEAFVMTKEAIKLFMKKDVEVEQDRDADKRKNSVYLRTAYIVAMVDATKICKVSKSA
ncbi:phage major capsid family protein [Bariatricus sp. HCP28S3_E4]|uniref:phage major capsid family protein n=1 Tax=unclassified Bariatricus TaxID=2677046 RepID=UPI003F888F29